MPVKIIIDKCTGCKLCIKACPYDAVKVKDKKAYLKDNCTSCSACVEICKYEAIIVEKLTEKTDLSAYKGVWVFAEQREGKLAKVGIQLLGRGRILADTLGVQLSAVLIGSNVKNLAEELIHYGADKVFIAEDEKLKKYQTDSYAKMITELINAHKPEIVLFGATHIGRDLAPRIAKRITAGLTADCTDLTIGDIFYCEKCNIDYKEPQPENLCKCSHKLKANKILLQTRPAFGGNIMATIITPNHRPQMATVRTGVFKEAERNENRRGEIIFHKVILGKNDIKTKILEIVKETRKVANLEDARIIVSGGRGVGGKEEFRKLEDLAKVLNAELGGSRVAVENGWITQDHQVGQTGKTVSPLLYIACGISGSIQHRAGMSSSEVIVAINKDKDAPIFKIADIGIVGDLHVIVPLLTEELKKEIGGV